MEEYTPLKDRFFSIDIYLPQYNIGIEVNGNQHYTKKGTLKEYYSNRHLLIEESGISLIEVHYLEVYKLDINDLLLNKTFINYKPIPQIKKHRQKKHIVKRAALVVKRRILLDKSGIDMSKFGWVSKVGDLWGISPQKVNSWIKKYYPDLDFFERNPGVTERSSKPCIVP